MSSGSNDHVLARNGILWESSQRVPLGVPLGVQRKHGCAAGKASTGVQLGSREQPEGGSLSAIPRESRTSLPPALCSSGANSAPQPNSSRSRVPRRGTAPYCKLFRSSPTPSCNRHARACAAHTSAACSSGAYCVRGTRRPVQRPRRTPAAGGTEGCPAAHQQERHGAGLPPSVGRPGSVTEATGLEPDD